MIEGTVIQITVDGVSVGRVVWPYSELCKTPLQIKQEIEEEWQKFHKAWERGLPHMFLDWLSHLDYQVLTDYNDMLVDLQGA